MDKKKVDKRSKAYRDSLKKLPKALGIHSWKIPKEQVDKMTESMKGTSGINMAICLPETVPAKIKSHEEHIEELHQDIKNLWATVNVLQEQVTNLQTKVG